MLKDSKGKKVFAKTRDVIENGPACRVSTFSFSPISPDRTDMKSMSVDLWLNGREEGDGKSPYCKFAFSFRREGGN